MEGHTVSGWPVSSILKDSSQQWDRRSPELTKAGPSIVLCWPMMWRDTPKKTSLLPPRKVRTYPRIIDSKNFCSSSCIFCLSCFINAFGYEFVWGINSNQFRMKYLSNTSNALFSTATAGKSMIFLGLRKYTSPSFRRLRVWVIPRWWRLGQTQLPPHGAAAQSSVHAVAGGARVRGEFRRGPWREVVRMSGLQETSTDRPDLYILLVPENAETTGLLDSQRGCSAVWY